MSKTEAEGHMNTDQLTNLARLFEARIAAVFVAAPAAAAAWRP